MSFILDDLEQIKKLDPKNMLGSLQLLSNQVEQIWKEFGKFKMPADYKKVQNVCVLGMGGSSIGAHVIKTLFSDRLKVPVDIINGYTIPKFVNEKTLVILSSYSGTTEEVLISGLKAIKNKAKVAVIASGEALAKMAKKYNLPAIIFSPDNNPCGSPRMGLGYAITGKLILFAKAGLIEITEQEIKKIVFNLKKYETIFGVTNPKNKNLAKQIAERTIDKSVWYVGSEHLIGNAHIATNQMNENGKRFAGWFSLPELNHHLLEGIANPESNKQNLFFVLFNSSLYHPRAQKRYQITKNVLDKNQIDNLIYNCEEKTRISQMAEILSLGSYISYYSALLKGIDPTDIPFVDYFKEELAK